MGAGRFCQKMGGSRGFFLEKWVGVGESGGERNSVKPMFNSMFDE